MSVFVLLERLAPLITREVNPMIYSNDEEAESLSSKLSRIQVGLQDAERVGVTDNKVKAWLKEVEDVTYEMDDVLDELETANLQVQLEDTSLNWDKVCSLLLSLCLCFKQVLSRREITLKMKALSQRIDAILIKKGEYTFVSSKDYSINQEGSTSLVETNIKVYGLDHVKNSLVEKLVWEGEGSDVDTQIISIVGLGGVGKTTLARLAYNHPHVDGHFSLKGWVSVSQAFDSLAIAKAILESFGENSDGAYIFETLVQRIKNVVNNKRFLLVLDNVWTEDRNKWKGLRYGLDGGRGSRIVVTTRLESVARMMGTTQLLSLDLLSDSECWLILSEVALKGRTREESEKLRVIGMEIAKKCNGLPLAAKSAGSMLALRSSTQEWMAVLESPLWNEDKASDLFRILNLSYTDLSPLLKCCLLSCVVFPKGTSLSIDKISRVWMAHGYLNSKGSVEEVQLKGFQYLNSLAMRSFFQRVATGDEDHGRTLYKMPDIIHDFATHLLGSDEYSYIRDGGLENGRSSYSHNMLPWNFLGRLRTFSVCREELRPDIVSHLTSVRVLSMRDCNLQGLPEDVGKLIHLRYLNVSDNPIAKLPETIIDLRNLQTLDIGRCDNLSSLPEGIEKLINLRHLVNRGTCKLVEFPQGLEKLTGLLTLSEFRGSSKLGCLRNLNQLQGSLSLFVQNLDEVEFGVPNLWEKHHIKKLQLEFGKEEQKDEIVEALKPPPNLLKLVIFSSSGKWLSRWITSFDNLKVVSFHGNRDCSDVPPFYKLPAVEEIAMYACGFKRLRMEFLGLEDASSSSREVVGGFPRLKKLSLLYCHEWEEWEDIEEECVHIMPLLEELEIRGSPRLEALPHRLLSTATSLRVVSISGSQGLYRRYNKVSGYDRHNIPQLPNQMWTVTE